jgi:triacylglycerol lipase
MRRGQSRAIDSWQSLEGGTPMGATRFDRIAMLTASLFVAACATDGDHEEPENAEEITGEADDAETAFDQLAALEVADGASARRPVVLVAGLMQDANTVAPLANALRARGLDVTLFVPPNLGIDDIHGYAKQLGGTVEEVRRRTGAGQVDLVGHSEGGLTARTYVHDAAGEVPVHTLISLGSPQQGTEGGLLSQVLRLIGCELWAPACQQMVAGSAFLKELNDGDPTPGEVRYVTVGTRRDGVVQPVSRAGIPGAENIVLQEVCRWRAVGHFGLLEDAWVHQVVLSVLAGGRPVGDCRARPIGGSL